ncbi:MAG: M4 family metallopeptidase, partial [Bacteroidaceae bacterium]|nr:M4 family metallopeptidase [Bacteroidaceae bacterium]
AVYSEKNNTGYTFYTYQQRYGGYTLRYATLRIVVDPDGYTAGLSCSFVPNVGTASQEPAIGAEEAVEIVQSRFARFNLTYFPEHTVRLAVPFSEEVLNCWVVYTNNPDATESFDMPYIEHYVTTDGEYVTLVPANSFASTNDETMDHSGYFQGMMVQRLKTTLHLQDGTDRDLDVPISYNPRDGKYYLMDPERQIAVASYYDFNYRGLVSFVTSDTLDGWEQNNLLAYANYILAYDFYADHGLRSVDGFDTPILVTVGWCDRDGTPVNNACFYGVNRGWACFGVSDINHSSDCLDVVGHEYTHGITNQSMQGVLYRNESGVINEAYSDIMGNLMEMSLGYTYDDSWLIAERSGRISRSMGDPNSHEQPAFVGDVYYVASVLNPNFDINDYGGVHINNSLVGNIACRLDGTGMSYEQQISMWLTSIELLTPQSDYQDLHGALLFALKINGMLQQYGPAVNRAFEDLGLTEDWTLAYRTVQREGCGRVTMYVDEETAAQACSMSFYDLDGNIFGYAFPDPEGMITALLPEGQYLAAFQYLMDNELQGVILRTDGWDGRGKYAALRIKNGDTLELPSVTGTDNSQKLDLFLFDAGYFTMLVPDGWRIEVNGEYSSFSIKLFDPDDPSTQLFYYSYLAPFHKS